MNLWERLLGLVPEKIPIDTFTSVVAEWLRGRFTRQQVVDAFALASPQTTNLDALYERLTAMNDPLTLAEVRDTLLIGESDPPHYKTVAAVKARFGV